MGGFVREGSSDDYVLLGGGGHKLLSEIRGTVYDAEIEYLENSSASQIIDTNYIPQGNGVEIGGSFYYMGYYTSNQWETLVYYTYVDENTNTFRLIRNGNSNDRILLNHNTKAGGGGTDVTVSLNSKYDFALNDNGYIFNGVQYARSTSQGAENTYSLKIFSGGHIRLYSFYIKKDGVLVHDFIPVRIGQVGYMYDKVTNELFGNSGTGNFVLGPDQYYLPLTGGTLTGQIGSPRFVKLGSSDSYVLLGGGGHKLESDLSVGYAGSTRVATMLGNNTDNRSIDNLPSHYYGNGLSGAGAVSSELAYTGSAHGWNETRITTVPWWDTSGGRPVQLALADSGAYLRTAASRTQWNPWQTIITSANIRNYINNIYDAEIEYLESTGTEWINTLYKPNNNTRIICDFQYTTSNNYPRIFGCSTGTEYNDVPTVQLDFETGVTTGKLHFMIGNDADWTITDITGDFNRHTYDFNTTRLIYDGTQVATYPDQTFQLITNLAIFAKVGPNYNPYPMEYASGKLYSFQIYESNELVRDFIPVRVGNIGYLYDKVSCKLFGNSGGGDFVLGQDTGPGGGMTYIPTIGGTNEGWIGTASPSYKVNVNGDVSATGFIKEDSSDSYVLLGGGGHMLLSEIVKTLYDDEIEYLESTGTQYIDTGVYLDTNDFEIGYEILGNYLAWGFAHQMVARGTWIGVGSDWAYFGTWMDANKISISTSATENIIKYESQRGLTVNGTFYSKTLSMGSDSITAIPLYIYADYDFYSKDFEYSSSKLKTLYIKKNGILVRDFIPVRVGQVGYLYDKVSGQLFGNSGTGDFVLGPDVSIPYGAEIEYLESTGTQWIDTLYKPNNNTRIICDFQYTQSNNYPRIFGCSSGANWNSVPSFQLNFETGVTTGTLGVCIGNNTAWTRVNIAGDFNRHTYDLTTTRLIYDGTQVATYSDQTFQCTTNLAIFARLSTNNATTSTEFALGKLYSFKIYENDLLVRDFIPVRVGKVGYLYDKVSCQLFGNSGTDDFVLGPAQCYLPITGGTITGNLAVNGNRCFLCNTTHPDARVNISDSAQIVKTNESYNPYLLFHIPNIDWGRIEFNTSGQFHFKNGETYTDYMPLYAASFNQTSDIRKKNIIDNVNINIYDIANAPLFKFIWKDENRYSGLHVGSSAQYWQTILPELTPIINDSNQILSMQYDVISLVSEIIIAKKTVEHEQKISYLENQITQLRNKLKNLKQCNNYVNNE